GRLAGGAAGGAAARRRSVPDGRALQPQPASGGAEFDGSGNLRHPRWASGATLQSVTGTLSDPSRQLCCRCPAQLLVRRRLGLSPPDPAASRLPLPLNLERLQFATVMGRKANA